jgi:hypothetical protein
MEVQEMRVPALRNPWAGLPHNVGTIHPPLDLRPQIRGQHLIGVGAESDVGGPHVEDDATLRSRTHEIVMLGETMMSPLETRVVLVIAVLSTIELPVEPLAMNAKVTVLAGA